jgi:hypothetical protein
MRIQIQVLLSLFVVNSVFTLMRFHQTVIPVEVMDAPEKLPGGFINHKSRNFDCNFKELETVENEEPVIAKPSPIKKQTPKQKISKKKELRKPEVQKLSDDSKSIVLNLSTSSVVSERSLTDSKFFDLDEEEDQLLMRSSNTGSLKNESDIQTYEKEDLKTLIPLTKKKVVNYNNFKRLPSVTTSLTNSSILQKKRRSSLGSKEENTSNINKAI